jgi:flagellar biosynthesis protein FlhB
VFGFAAFGAHLRNYLPVLLGVYLSTFFSQYAPNDAGMLIAAFFVVGIAPIAGQFGPIWGIISGMLHSCIVMCTSTMYGGLNLYNNGFSCGWVAIVMIPIIESFMRGYQIRKQMRKQKRELKKENKGNDS